MAHARSISGYLKKRAHAIDNNKLACVFRTPFHFQSDIIRIKSSVAALICFESEIYIFLRTRCNRANIKRIVFLVYYADGGEGHVGTVCEIGRFGSTHSPEKTVVVNWDSGHRTNYRVGYQGQYDLIIIDNAQIGKYVVAAVLTLAFFLWFINS